MNAYLPNWTSIPMNRHYRDCCPVSCSGLWLESGFISFGQAIDEFLPAQAASFGWKICLDRAVTRIVRDDCNAFEKVTSIRLGFSSTGPDQPFHCTLD
ncbi:MAG: hypothetical protein ACRD8U_11515 [Pyrinomonadaceae bacterium]